MYINPDWRILTIGDGDLSFSAAILKHHQPRALTATVFDDLAQLGLKYGDSFYQQLQQANIAVHTCFDVTKPDSWHQLSKQTFDLVIFQFPLIPGFKSKAQFEAQCLQYQPPISVNTLNRNLLRQYIVNCFNHFLDPKGQGLCYITSKDVKPYREWDIETGLLYNLAEPQQNIQYQGQMPFNINKFPNYQIRNVDRDKHVKDTQGNVYVFSQQPQPQLAHQLKLPTYADPKQSDSYCRLCRVGPFFSAADKLDHAKSKRHQKMLGFEQQWQAFLTNQTT